jgi:WD40-like Beta Propeller Repeat
MIRTSVLLMILSSVPGIAQAAPHGCSALAAERGGRDLWIVLDSQAPRRVLSTEHPIAAGALSPDGRHIAFSASGPTYAFPQEVVIAEPTGRILAHFKVDKGYGEGGLRLIDGVEWHGPRTLVTLGEAGPNGGYMDVWRLSENYSGAEKVRRTAFLGGSCAVSPSTRYVACAGSDMIMIYDTSSPTDGIVDDQRVFATQSPDGRVEGNLVWNSTGLVLYAVRPLNGKRVLTSIEQNPAATEGWSITDRELVGIHSRVVSVEADAHGALLLSDDRQVAYRIDGGPAAARSDAVAHIVSPTELRRPSRALEIASDSGKLRLSVLDTLCQGSAAQQ